MTPCPSDPCSRPVAATRRWDRITVLARWVLPVALLLLAVPAPAGPSTRLDGVAGDDVVTDAADPLRWFASLPDAAGLARFVWGDYRPAAPASRRVTRQAATVYAPLGRDGRLGTAGLALFRDRPDRSAQILLGHHRRRLDLAVSLAWRDHYDRLSAGGEERAWQARDVTPGVGVRWEIGPGAFLDAATAWTAARRRLAAAAGTAPLRSDGTAWTAARVRLFLALDEHWVLVPVVTWDGADRPDRPAGADTVYRRVADTYDLRLALLALPDPDTAWHVTLVHRSAREHLRDPVPAPAPTGTRRVTAWAARLGWERRVSPWCALRCGATLAVADPDGSYPGAAAAPFTRFDLVIGASFQAGDVVLDVAASDDPPALPRPDERGDPLAASRAWTSVTLSAPF